jgi:hypothetical protein
MGGSTSKCLLYRADTRAWPAGRTSPRRQTYHPSAPPNLGGMALATPEASAFRGPPSTRPAPPPRPSRHRVRPSTEPGPALTALHALHVACGALHGPPRPARGCCGPPGVHASRPSTPRPLTPSPPRPAFHPARPALPPYATTRHAPSRPPLTAHRRYAPPRPSPPSPHVRDTAFTLRVHHAPPGQPLTAPREAHLPFHAELYSMELILRRGYGRV